MTRKKTGRSWECIVEDCTAGISCTREELTIQAMQKMESECNLMINLANSFFTVLFWKKNKKPIPIPINCDEHQYKFIYPTNTFKISFLLYNLVKKIKLKLDAFGKHGLLLY